jgi:hypothetical protein
MNTIQDKVAFLLISKGVKEIIYNSRKYRVFEITSKNKSKSVRIFLGKRGAIRIGSAISTSRAVIDVESYLGKIASLPDVK